jgi:hypothetical protein
VACVFCGQSGSSEEHVFAKWLSEVMPGEGYFRSGGTPPRREKESRLISITNRATCEDCNSGWMSRMEQDVEPLIAPAIQGQPVTWESDEEQTIVAAWAFKTALMLDASHAEPYVPADHYRYLYEHRQPPPLTTIRVGKLAFLPERGQLEAASMQRTRLEMKGEQTGTTVTGYRMVFSVGFLAFRLFGYDDEQEVTEELGTITYSGVDVVERDFLPQLWPLAGAPFVFPPKAAFAADVLMKEFG